MFFSINFVFLLSLGFLSWTILCYFNQIENKILDESEEARGIPIVCPTMSEQPIPSTIKNHVPRDNYEFYVNFLCIFVCIYALAKITHLAENYMAKRLQRKFYDPSFGEIDLEFDTLDELHKQQTNLLRKINKLEKQNLELKYKLLEAEDIQDPNQTIEENINKIYISNKHVHLNRQVYVNKKAVSMKFRAFPDKRRTVNEIWDKYLEMQNSAHQNPVSLQTIEEMGVHKPVVMSNEELQNFQGNAVWEKYLKMPKIANEISVSLKANSQITSHMPVVLTDKELNNIQGIVDEAFLKPV